MTRFILACMFVLFSGMAHAAGTTPAQLQETLNARLNILLAADNTLKPGGSVTVTKVGSDWVIHYPELKILKDGVETYLVSKSEIRLKNPNDMDTGDAVVTLPEKITVREQSQTTLMGQNLVGKWSFKEHLLTEIKGSVANIKFEKGSPIETTVLNNVNIDLKATVLNADTVDLAFNVKTGAGTMFPSSMLSGLLPQNFSATGIVTKLPKEYLILGALLPLAQGQSMTKAGTTIASNDMHLVATNGAEATGTVTLRADATSKRGVSGGFTTRWKNLNVIAQKMQTALLSSATPAEERKALTQQILGFMLIQGMGAQEGDETVFAVELPPAGGAIINGRDMAAAGSALLGQTLSKIPPQLLTGAPISPNAQIPVDSPRQTP